ncbi:hypothetical protein STIUS_v1c04670 [Spiroplasma sp. TIUS-1]|uniref:hypothetical protein n=1 Tax=Spiroplasma sp. TIUS-1 TaxID=216963 RepID=UPI0013985B52|nr:hypothetical protein [Spiroplasma sp. TIUS-1]QHX36021.1 hypothetical protein STIUS_v1c04670 [Spiroplasma sp. TIUS-1]
MTIIANVIFWIFIACIALYILIRLINVSIYGKTQPFRIVDEHTTISDVEINDLGNKYLEHLKTDLKLEYATHEEYVSVYDQLDEKNETIVIPKWYMSSAGYELDYVFASIWFNTSLYNKNKFAKVWRSRAILIPFYSALTFWIALAFSIVLKITTMVLSNTAFLVGEQLLFDILMITFSLIGTIGTMIYIMCIIYVNTYKNLIEAQYESSLSSFITKECKIYKDEIIAARHYAISISKVDMRTFKINKTKAGELKFMGPFVII